VKPAHEAVDPRLAERLAIRVRPLVEAVREQYEHVACGHLDPRHALVGGLGNEGQRQALRREFPNPSRRRLVQQDRPLAGAHVVDRRRGWIDDAAERRHEPVLGQVETEQPVDLGDRMVQAGRPAHDGAKQRPRLHAHEGGTDPVAGGVGDRQRQPAIGQREEVEEVAAGLVGRPVPSRDVEPRHARLVLRQQPLLDRAGDAEIAFDPPLLGEGVEQPLPLDRHARLASQKSGDLLVAVVERAGPLVEELEHPDRGVVVAGEPHGQHAPGPKAARAVDVGIEPRVGVRVGQIDHDARRGHRSGDAATRGKPDLGDGRVGDAGGDPAVQFVGVRIVEEHRRPLAVEQGGGDVHDRRQHGVEIDGGPQPAGHGEQPLEVGHASGGG